MILILILFFIIILESTIIPLPLTLLALFFLKRRRIDYIFEYAFFSGIILDLFTLRPLGSDSLIFIIFLAVSFIFERKYHRDNVVFSFIQIAIFAFLFYYFYFGFSHIWALSLLLLAFLVFNVIVGRIYPSTKKQNLRL